MLTGIGPRRTLVMLLGTALGCALVLLGALVLTPPLPVAAVGAVRVTNCSDSGGAGDGSLRGEIAAAPATFAIVFNVDCTGATPITLSSTITLAKNLTIDGIGRTIVVDGGCTVSGGTCTSGTGVTVFAVNSGVTATLNNLTIQHGNANSGSGAGGGIYNNGGTVTLTNSTLSANSATNGSGGGIFNKNGMLNVTNSTLSANSAAYGGGIYTLGGTVTLTNGTLSGNSASIYGGGMYNNVTVTVTNTIVAGNTATSRGPDVFGAVSSGGHNLIGETDDSTGFMGTGDQTGTVSSPLDALLGGLGSDGGPTPTIPLLAGSPAIGGVPHANCTLTTDQRRLPRSSTGACAIGAFEPHQATYTVGSLSDMGAMDTFADCQSATNTTCKLRDALAYASSGKDTVAFNGTGNGKITLTSGTLTVAGNVTITGPTSGTGVIVDGGCTANCGTASAMGGVGVFIVNPDVTMGINNLTIQHGNATSDSGNGGGIYNTYGGTVMVTNSTLSGNSARVYGGGIDNNGTLIVTNSTFSGNSAIYGGGIYNDVYSSAVTLTNSTITGNTTHTAGQGGGICIYRGTATLTNTIVAGNTLTGMGGSGPDVQGTVMSDGHNLIGETDGSIGFMGIGDQTGMIANPLNPLLGTLSSNGGPTPTIPLMPGSPAINAGAAVGSGPMGNPVPALDQRGDARVGAPDIGAFEVQSFTLVVNSTADGTANAGNCAAGNSNLCRLRDAIAAVTPGNSTITFDTSVFPSPRTCQRRSC